jgi:hypothetical protein
MRLEVAKLAVGAPGELLEDGARRAEASCGRSRLRILGLHRGGLAAPTGYEGELFDAPVIDGHPCIIGTLHPAHAPASPV